MKHLLVFLFVCGLVMPARAVTCNADQYIKDNVCTNCIYNAICDGETYTCIDGFYDTGDNECAACPPNTICTSPTEFTCKPGSYLSGDVCAVCPDNATCAGGDADFHCNDGYYHNRATNLSCAACGTRAICADGELVRCGAGYYLHSSGTCWACSGFYCPEGKKEGCDDGYYSLYSDRISCAKCGAEYYCPKLVTTINNYKQYCAPGYYKTDDETCIQCPSDVVCPGMSPDGIKCPDNLYAHSNGQCLSYDENDHGTPPNCHAGYFPDGDICSSCPVANSLCTSDTEFICMDGYYKNGTECVVCPDNSICPAGSEQINCLPGYYLDKGECTVCSTGYYCADNMRNKCPDIDLVVSSTVLDADEYFIDPGRLYGTGVNQITDCHFLMLRVQSPMGKYIYSGIYYDGEQYTNISYKDRKYWYEASTGYYMATYNPYNNVVAYKYVYTCTNAPDNSHYTGAGTPDGNDCPWICDTGYYRNGNQCVSCPSGKVCVNDMIITACPLGQFAVGDGCESCPAGYGARSPDNIAPQSEFDCQIECPGGTYLATAQTTECIAVDKDHWNGVNYTNYGNTGVRNACPVGLTTTGSGTGADEAGDCGSILHIDPNHTLRLRSHKRTSPSLAVRVGDYILYGDTTTEKRGHLRVNYNGYTYSVYNPDFD